MQNNKAQNKYFEKALSGFVHNMASGDEIRHLAGLGYTVEKIYHTIGYPTSREQIGKTVWQYYIDKGIICLDKPSKEPYIERIDYIQVQGKYGSRAFKQVKIQEEKTVQEYISCDFGKERYQNETAFLKKLEALLECDREYILGLPWPLQRVYHARDERMERISASFHSDS